MPTNVPTSLAAPRSIGPRNPQATMQHVREILAAHNCYGLNWNAPWLEKVLDAYRQPHRFFHTLDHLESICELIHEKVAEPATAAQMLLAALFHDAVWFPQRADNEAQSARLFDQLAPAFGAELPQAAAEAVRTIILTTKSQRKVNAIARQFHEFDCNILLHGDKVDLLAYEFQIFREFQFLNLQEYRKGRSAFFKRFSQRFPEAGENMSFLVEYLERRRPRVGLYAGTFNPFHIGHFGILQKAEMMFDKVIIAVGLNPSKNLHHAHSEVAEQVRRLLPFHEVIFFDTLMVDLLEELTAFADITLVRGLRNGYDLDYEMSQQAFMSEMRPDTASVYIPCDKQFEHISSSALRSLKVFDCRGRDQIYYPHLYDYYPRE
ncbi:MAG: adenylyltransferase/cytidyltransferase family protein [Victivallales bacterium]|nr:adenylyltransferase/cytidyltransferase family protein [Victivallales bacterium]